MLRSRIATVKDDGFTLIELLIVIVILGILAGIVTFGVAQFRSDSTTAACKTDKKNVDTALSAYNAKNNSYPSSGDVQALVDGNYLKSLPATTGFAWSGAGVISAPSC